MNASPNVPPKVHLSRRTFSEAFINSEKEQRIAMAQTMAKAFLLASFGKLPPGADLRVAWANHSLTSAPEIWLEVPEDVSEDEHVNHSNELLQKFAAAVEWKRIRPILFRNDDPPCPDDGEPRYFVDPDAFLDHLADTLVQTYDQCAEDARENLMFQFFKSVRDMKIDWVSFDERNHVEAIRCLLSPGNPGAAEWARQCFAYGGASSADPDDFDSVIGCLWWPDGRQSRYEG